MLKFHLRPERGIGVGQTRDCGMLSSIRESSKFEDRGNKRTQSMKGTKQREPGVSLKGKSGKERSWGPSRGWLGASVCHIRDCGLFPEEPLKEFKQKWQAKFLSLLFCLLKGIDL